MTAAVTAPAGEAAPRGRVITAFAVLYLVWGSTYLAMRIGVETLPPFLLGGVRFAIAGAILYLWSRHRQPALRPARAHWKSAALSGLLLLVGGNAGVVWAVRSVPSGLAALVVATVPLWMVLLVWALEGARPRWQVVLGLFAGLAGIALLLGPDAFSTAPTAVPPLAAGVLLAASLSWAAGSMAARRGPKLAGAPFLLTGMQMLVGGAAQLALSLATGELGRLTMASVAPRSLAALAYLVVFGSLIGYSAFIWLLEVAPPARVSTYAYVNPVVAVLLGWALGGEPLTVRIAVAAAIIVGAVVVINRS